MDKTAIAAAIAAGELINVGTIKARLAPLSIDAAGLAQLGFLPAAALKNSKLYRASYLPLMRMRLLNHLAEVEAPENSVLVRLVFQEVQSAIEPFVKTLASTVAPAATNAP